MNKIITLIALFSIAIISCSAQVVVPIEKQQYYIDNNIEIKPNTYFKDVNGVLNKFVGTWKGTSNFKNYELQVFKNIWSNSSSKNDELLAKYKITSNNGTVIENTLSLQKDNPLVLGPGYVDPRTVEIYVLSYSGRDDDCGQNGNIHLSVSNTNTNRMSLTLIVSGEKLDCTGANAQQVFPINSVVLTKQ
ncbi:DUF6705 family protein [Aquimarina algiphila]|uniref:DUF6705 family protein n=1 Tax=Aquimarina algiphila TaxID=2047982 RepID=UPI00232DA574|nr:DUF6705 family protein [Aquimarina algiphila]